MEGPNTINKRAKESFPLPVREGLGEGPNTINKRAKESFPLPVREGLGEGPNTISKRAKESFPLSVREGLGEGPNTISKRAKNTLPKTFLSILLAWISLANLAQAEAIQFTFDSVDMVPMSALQLGDVALVSPELLKQFQVEAGQAAELSAGDQQVEVLLYPIDRPHKQVSLKKTLRDQLGVQPGNSTVHLRLLSKTEQKLQPMAKEIRIEAHQGIPEKWPGIVLGAPHGDCDMFTGEVVEIVAQTQGVPSVCAYGSRISFLGRWIDVNRPLQRRPNPNTYGILPYRDWTDEAAKIFAEFRDKVSRVGAQQEQPAGSLPLRLYVDFHGHDLNVTSDKGKKIYRNVFECMVRGFTLAEIRLLKHQFDRCIREEYGEQAPPSYWGNLPEDRTYEVAGYPAGFFYSGLGAREYGILASNVAQRAIHIESPNSVRVPKAVRTRTARALGNFVAAVEEEILLSSIERQSVTPPDTQSSASGAWAQVPAGKFLMGAPVGQGWDIEHPQHWVQLSAYEISKTEVTCSQYAKFLNAALRNQQAAIREGQVFAKDGGQPWCVLWPKGHLAMLKQEGNSVVCVEGRHHHPVNYVTWYGAQAMAEAQRATLPTEAQWERAGGWDDKSQRWYRTCLSLPAFPPQVEAALMNSGHESENYLPPATCPVGSFTDSMSPVGCYDMSGNVWEWTLDWLAHYPESDTLLRDPAGPETGTMRAIRGGGWDTERSTATPSFRLGVSPDQALPNVGFRLVRTSVD